MEAIGAAMVLSLTLVAVMAPLIAPHDPAGAVAQSFGDPAPPSRAFPLGTDQLGRDVLSRMIYGARISLTVGVAAMVITMTIGVAIGLLSGFFGALAIMAAYFLLCMRLTYFKEWYWDADVQRTYSVLSCLNREHQVRHVATTWEYRGPLNFYQAAPETIKALVALEAQIQASGLEKSLIELVKTRASQINGCAYCINMHTADARKQGETEERLYLLNAWRESPLYTDRERAALAWTEALTLIAETHAPDDLYENVRAHFSEAETVNLTMLIGAINAWNRVAISFRAIHPVRAKAAVA